MTKRKPSDHRPALVRGATGDVIDPKVLYRYAEWIIKDEPPNSDPNLQYSDYPRTVPQFVRDLAFPYHPLTGAEELFLRKMCSVISRGYDVRNLLGIPHRKAGHRERDPWADRVAEEVARRIEADPVRRGARARAVGAVADLTEMTTEAIDKLYDRWCDATATNKKPKAKRRQ